MTGTWNDQLADFRQGCCSVITPVNITASLQRFGVGAANHEDLAPFSCYSSVERRYLELNIKWNDLPFQGFIVFDVADLDNMKGGVRDLEEVKEGLGLEEVFCLDPEGILLKQAVSAENRRICGI